MSMLLMRRTRSLTSQVSYLAGMIFTAAIGGRARLGDDRWLDDGVDGTSVNVVDDAVLGSDAAMVASELLVDRCGASAGSGGGASGDTDLSLRFPLLLTGSVVTGMGIGGGEYCVPTSTMCLGGDFDDLVDVDRERLREA